jgi:hypothetical protein
MIEPALLLPFWATTTMYGESVTFLDRGGRTSDAALLFRPRAVLKVTSSAGDVDYEDGGDYTIDRTAGRILRLPDSRMPMLPASRHASDGGGWRLGNASNRCRGRRPGRRRLRHERRQLR